MVWFLILKRGHNAFLARVSWTSSYSLGKENSKSSAQAVCLQFPLKLAFAATAHKCQGMTVPKPLPLIVDIRKAFEAAMVYVILSRVQALIQLFIIAYLDITKIYCNEDALKEVERLSSKALNNSWSEWFVPVSDDNKKVKISFLNIVSLRKHFSDLKTDHTLKKSDVICLAETSLFENNKETQELYLSGYDSNFNSCGLKKGLACYFREEFFHEENFEDNLYQISKIGSAVLDIISIYRSPRCKETQDDEINIIFEQIISGDKTTIVLGDFNIEYFSKRRNILRANLEKKSFIQYIEASTHIDGGLIDHAYVRLMPPFIDCIPHIHSCYYSDHDAICLSLIKE